MRFRSLVGWVLRARARVALLVTLALFAAAGSAAADSSSTVSSTATTLTVPSATTPTATSPAGSSSTASAISSGLSQAVGDLSNWQAWLAAPAQVAARLASRTRFESQTDAEAQSTDNTAFPSLVGAGGFRSLDLGTGGRVLQRLSAGSALVQRADGSRSVAVSNLPLYGKTPTGAQAPVDLNLGADPNGSGFVPDSALVPVEIPASSGGTLSFPGLGVGVGFGQGATVTGQQQGATVFYPNALGAGSDTDIVAQARPQGGELQYVLRSQRSPQTFTLTFSLPAGWTLSPRIDTGDVEIIDGSGAVKGLLPAPIANDAQGQSVPASYQLLSGNVLQVTVNHQVGDFAYPIDVDPTIIDTGTNSLQNYSFTGNWDVIPSTGFLSFTTSGGTYAGWKLVDGDTYNTSQYARFQLRAPPGGYIYEFDAGGVNEVSNLSEMVAGIHAASGWEQGTWTHNTAHGTPADRYYVGTISNAQYVFCARAGCATGSTSTIPTSDYGNNVIFGLQDATAGKESGAVGYDELSDATVYLDDNNTNPPAISVTHSGYTPGTWINDTTNPVDNVTFNVSQPGGGMGVARIDISRPSYPDSWFDWKSCSVVGGQISCPALTTATMGLEYAGAEVSEGVNTFTATDTAYDGQTNSTGTSWNVDIDNTPPVLALSGALAGSSVMVGDGSYQLTATSEDGSSGSSTDVSGVQSITGQLDSSAQTPGSDTAPCAGAGGQSLTDCTAAASWTVDATALSGGLHSFVVDSADEAGNQSSKTANFYVAHPPTISGTPKSGDTLSVTPGPWSGAPPTYGDQWQDCPVSGGSCTDIAGATGTGYTVQPSDLGSKIRVAETVTVGSSSITVNSASTAEVTQDSPTISGSDQVGQTLTATPASSDPSGLSYPSYQWLSCTPSGSSCTNIPGATGQNYTLTASDVGSTVEAEDVATGSGGQSATSPASGATGLIEPAPVSGVALTCTDSWAVVGAGSWSTAANWTNGVPSSSDVVCVRGGYAQQSSVTVGSSATVSELEAQGASVTLDGGGTLSITGTSIKSGASDLQLGDGGGAGSLSSVGEFDVESAMDWVNGAVSGGGKLVLAATANSEITPASGDSIDLSATSVINQGALAVSCEAETDQTGALTLIEGDNGASLDNQGTLSFSVPGGTGRASGCAFGQGSGAASVLHNEATISETAGSGAGAIDLGWQFNNSALTTSVIGAEIDLFGGQTAPIDGAWTNSTLDLEAGGAYSITDPLAEFGPQSATASDIVVGGAPGASGAPTTSFTTYLAGNSTAPQLAITANGLYWGYGTVTANGPLTLGQSSGNMTIGNLVENGGAPITVAGNVTVAGTFTGNQAYVGGSGQLTVDGSTVFSGAATFTGSSLTVTLQGGVTASGTLAVTTAGPLNIPGAVASPGDATFDIGGVFHDDGTTGIGGTLTVTSPDSADVEFTAPVTAGSVTLGSDTLPVGRATVLADVTANQLTSQATGDITLKGTLNGTASASLSTPASIDVGATQIVGSLTVTGGGTTTINDPVTATNLTAGGEIVNNLSTITLGNRLLADNGAQIINDNTITATPTVGDGVSLVSAPNGPPAQLTNTSSGALTATDNGSSPTNLVSVPFTSQGGSVSDTYLLNDHADQQYGGGNVAMADVSPPDCGDGADCGTGDYTQQQTDLSISDYSGGLQLTRSYSSLLAEAQASPGMFGYGWQNSFQEYLNPNASLNDYATIQNSDGSITELHLASTSPTHVWGGDSTDTSQGVFGTITQGTDANNNTIYTYVAADQSTTVFNDAGYPTSITTRAGQTTTYTYTNDPSNPVNPEELTTVTAPSGRSITFTYRTQAPGDGLVGTATDPSGLTVTYTYDGNDNLVQVSDSAGPATTAWSYDYDGSDCAANPDDHADLHRLTCVIQNGTNKASIVYNDLGYVKRVTDPNGNQDSWTYLPQTQYDTSENAPLTTTETDSNGTATDVTKYQINSADQPSTVIDESAAGGATTTQMNYAQDSGQLSSQVDETAPGGPVTTKYTYYAASDPYPGGLKTETDPGVGQTYGYTYDSQGDVLTETTPSGMTKTYTYDSGGRPLTVSVSNPSVAGTPTETTQYGYNTREEQTSVTTPEGHTASSTYYANGDLKSTTDALGNTTTYGYDVDGRQTCETTPKVTASEGNCWDAPIPANAGTKTYDAVGDLLSQTAPDGGVTSYTYSADQEKTSQTDPNGGITTYGYDANGQQTCSTAPSVTASEGGCDSVPMPANASRTTYDAFGNITSQTNGNTDATTYTYTADGQLASSTDPLQNTTSYTYDSDGNLKSVAYPAVGNSPSEVTTYSYNAQGQNTGISYSNSDPGVTYAYTLDGQLQSMTDGSGTTTYNYDGLDRLRSVDEDGRTITYGYNTDNEPISVGYPNGQSVTQDFNQDDQLSSVTDWLGNTTTFGYTPDSNLGSTTFPSASGEQDTYAYNLDDQPTSINVQQDGSSLATLAYSYDPADLITNNTQTGLPGATSTTYSYNADQQVTGAGSQTYAYDHAHNLTEFNSSGANSYSYNGDSQLTSSPSDTYAYNTLGERTTKTPTSGTTATSYSYNAAQDLTGIGTSSNPTATASYQYNGSGLLMGRRDSSGTSELTWDLASGSPQLLTYGTENYLYGPNGEAFEQIGPDGTAQYLHQDNIGSTRVITSATGSVIGTMSYDAYGGLVGSAGTATSALGYAGQFTDPATGFTYNQARWFDTGTGQFVSVDPEVTTTLQPYAYGNGNPLSNTDPTGEVFHELWHDRSVWYKATCGGIAAGLSIACHEKQVADDLRKRAAQKVWRSAEREVVGHEHMDPRDPKTWRIKGRLITHEDGKISYQLERDATQAEENNLTGTVSSEVADAGATATVESESGTDIVIEIVIDAFL